MLAKEVRGTNFVACVAYHIYPTLLATWPCLFISRARRACLSWLSCYYLSQNMRVYRRRAVFCGSRDETEPSRALGKGQLTNTGLRSPKAGFHPVFWVKQSAADISLPYLYRGTGLGCVPCTYGLLLALFACVCAYAAGVLLVRSARSSPRAVATMV